MAHLENNWPVINMPFRKMNENWEVKIKPMPLA